MSSIKRDKLDILFSKLIRLRADGHCEYCGIEKEFAKLQTSHFIGRRIRQTRWDIDNACGLCYGCHNRMSDYPHIHTEFFRQRLGSVYFDELCHRAYVTSKPDKKAAEQNLLDKLAIMESE